MTLSLEHERMVNKARQVMETKPPVRDETIARIWGDQPILISTFTHPSVDPEARIVIGDLLWNEVIAIAQKPFTAFHLAWEPSPPGQYKILEIPIPNGSGSFDRKKIDSGFAVIPWLLPASEANTSRFFANILDPDAWQQTADSIFNSLQNTELLEPKKEAMFNNLELLQQIYSNILTSPDNYSLTLSQVAEKLYLRLASEFVGTKITSQLKPKSGYIPEIGLKLNKTLLALDQIMPLEIILQNLFEQGAQKLFVAGDQADKLAYVGFSTKKKRFSIDTVDPRTAMSIGQSQPIEKNYLITLLQSGAIFPTSKVFFIALNFIASQLPVAHMGNDYGWREKTQTVMKANQPFHQIFPDFADSWPFIIPTVDGHPYTVKMVTLSGLYVLFKDHPNIAEYVWQSLSSGSPISLEI